MMWHLGSWTALGVDSRRAPRWIREWLRSSYVNDDAMRLASVFALPSCSPAHLNLGAALLIERVSLLLQSLRGPSLLRAHPSKGWLSFVAGIHLAIPTNSRQSQAKPVLLQCLLCFASRDESPRKRRSPARSLSRPGLPGAAAPLPAHPPCLQRRPSAAAPPSSTPSSTTRSLCNDTRNAVYPPCSSSYLHTSPDYRREAYPKFTELERCEPGPVPTECRRSWSVTTP
ncbi:hypothetical protein B0I35DRAFT_43003 [Stachybotrys elegans]|uniref:Uncharacterized protein n=1 Tax=Stachybotrys elegans TaxID=80388 RepID=A0A8K0T776_9HYPO|nr:hypothetical protein B0I35DRAFT_43003 [Stachybotrys elegans]